MRCNVILYLELYKYNFMVMYMNRIYGYFLSDTNTNTHTNTLLLYRGNNRIYSLSIADIQFFVELNLLSVHIPYFHVFVCLCLRVYVCIAGSGC